MAMKQLTEILTKKPFARVLPDGYHMGSKSSELESMNYFESDLEYQLISQADYIRELDPNGHMINDTSYYPDKIKKIPERDEEGNYKLDDAGNKIYKYYIQHVLRASFPFQQIIKTQQLIHLCGNDLHHELNSVSEDEAENNLFVEFKKGWSKKQMDTTFFHFCDSIKSTGDGAIAFYIKDGKMGTKVLSYLNGDTLYPHYDSITGNLNCFARKYNDVDDDGNIAATYVEVWDEKYFYRYKQSATGIQGAINKIAAFFKLDGYSLVSQPEEHRCNRVPIIYFRDPKGACWTDVQDTIDMYELGFSHLCQNNMAYAFPILVLKGDNINIEGDITDGAVKGISGDKDFEADYLKAPENPESFKLQLEVMLKNIFLGSFTVKPPEMTSGDTPGIAIKLIYSPSIEKAIIDISYLASSIQDMTDLFKFFYGLESESIIRMSNLDIQTWAIPYIHQNTQELINNLVQMKGAGIISAQTASEETGYGKNNEWERIVNEQKEAQQSDVLTGLLKKQKDTIDAANQKADTIKKQQENNLSTNATE